MLNYPPIEITFHDAAMFTNECHDLHLHLNGSFSLDFLKNRSRQNNTGIAFEHLQWIQAAFAQLKAMPGHQPEAIELIWMQFEAIHQIIRKHEDITLGVLDVAENSDASYLEIRSTPKALDNACDDRYITAFIEGLAMANQTFAEKRRVAGTLSLDRSVHGLDDAKRFLAYVEGSSHLVGLDVSGNPTLKRTLTGTDLGELILLCLNKRVGISLHAGEVDTPYEKQDIDVILGALESWLGQGDDRSLQGRVRLGHMIYFTEEQAKRIRALQVPIEICPSCHEVFGWKEGSRAHPVTRIYPSWDCPIVPGTDDALIFGSSSQAELKELASYLGYSNSDFDDFNRHHAKFRF